MKRHWIIPILYFITGLLAAMACSEVWALTCTSKSNGTWNTANRWNCGAVPSSGDTVIIANNITLDTSPTVASLTVNTGSTLNETNGGTKYSLTTGSLTNSGTFTASSTGADSYGSFTNGGTYTGNGGSVSLSGTFSNSGTFTEGSGTWTFNGTVAQSTSSAASFTNVTISNTNGVTLGGNMTVSGVLTLGANTITTSTYLLAITGTCTSALSRTTGFVVGNLQLTFAAGTATCTYPVGTGTTYAPITLTITSTSGGTLTGSTTGSAHPQIASSQIDTNHNVNRYWTLFATGDTLTTSNVNNYNATFVFASSDVDTGSNPSSFLADQYINSNWTFLITPSATSSTSTSIANIAGMAGFGDFVIGQSINNCFHDTFARANGVPGANWSVGKQYGAWTPQIVTVNTTQRLQLTDTNGAEATWATLLTTFPGAGNQVSIDFDAFAYGGTGADGIGIILSDASVPPVAGAFGGSMGFAQKSNPGSDCTNTGGCPGFAGGWLGVALDEYGNYSTATEGRYYGQTQYGYNGSTRVPESVSMRGSGSGMSGYRFLAGTNSLTPIIDGTANQNANPPYHYRITVNHLNGINAYVSVERDTTTGGSSYTTLLGCPASNISGCGSAIDALDPLNSQDPVPTNWLLSFTAASGGSTNYHQVGNLTVCSILGARTITLDHIAIVQPGSACTANPASIVIKACANTDCSSLYLAPVNVTLSTTGHATWSSSSPLTITNGQATLTLSDTTAETVSIGATAVSPLAVNPTLCYNNAGTQVSCTAAITYSICAFDIIEVGANAYTPIYTKLAGVSFTLDVLSLFNTSQTVTKYEIVDASTGTCSSYASLVSTTTSSSFSAGQRRTVSFSDANAVRNARIRLTYGSNQYACSSDNFAIRPSQFTLTTTATNATSTTGTPVFKAGTELPTITATAIAGYDGTPKFNLTSGSSMISVGTPNTQTLGAISSAGFTTANSSGVATASLNYFDAGNLSMAANAVYDDGFTAVDATKPNPECTPDFSNTHTNGMYGCMFGSPILGLGRFIPDHFTITSPQLISGCSAGTVPYTYMGQDFTMGFTMSAVNGIGQTTINYDPSKFAAGFGTTSWSNYGFSVTNGGTSTLTTGTALPTGTWSKGVANITASGNYNRPSAPQGSFPSFSIYAVPSYTDGETISATSTLIGTTAMRFGILWLGNTYGTDIANLSIPYQFQYWNGTTFVSNTDDKCSTFTTANIGLTNDQFGLTTTNMNSSHLTAINTSSSGGGGTITLTPPTPSGGIYYEGSVDLVVDLGTTSTTNSPAPDQLTNLVGANLSYLRGNWYSIYPWSSDPVCRATFGIYNNNRSGPGPVYLRENY